MVPYQVFAARDGHLIVATGNESQYRAYCAAIGAPELGDDPRFATNRLRIRNRDELVGLLSAIMLQGRRDDWIDKLEAAGVPCGPINDIAQAFAHPQAVARQLRRDLPHPAGGVAAVTASPLRFSDTPVATAARRRCWASTPRKCCARCWASPWMRSRPSSRRWPRADQATLRSEDAGVA